MGIEGYVVRDSLDLLCCVLEQDLRLVQPSKTGNRPNMTGQLLTGT